MAHRLFRTGATVPHPPESGPDNPRRTADRGGMGAGQPGGASRHLLQRRIAIDSLRLQMSTTRVIGICNCLGANRISPTGTRGDVPWVLPAACLVTDAVMRAAPLRAVAKRGARQRAYACAGGKMPA